MIVEEFEALQRIAVKRKASRTRPPECSIMEHSKPQEKQQYTKDDREWRLTKREGREALECGTLSDDVVPRMAS
jgi:hypothetical protein